MTFKKWALVGASLILATAAWADSVTYYVGFKDLAGAGSDYDYNDLVFSLSGDGLALNQSGGVWSPKPATLWTSGPRLSPFWNGGSMDGPEYNVGYCIYGGGECGPGLDPSADYLATSSGGAVDNVYFSVSGTVDSPVYFHIAADHDIVGWYLIGTPSVIHWINSPGPETGLTFSFTPGGAFGLVAENVTTGTTFYSQVNAATDAAGGTVDNFDSGLFDSHFAFFGAAPIPEPGSVILFGSALLGLSLMLRRRNNAR